MKQGSIPCTALGNQSDDLPGLSGRTRSMRTQEAAIL